MLRRVSIIVRDNPYNTVRSFSKGLQRAFEEKKIATQWVDAGPSAHLPTDALQAIYAFAPDLTLSFSEIDPLPDGRYLWDAVEIPHLSLLIDPAIYFMNQIDSRYLLHSCIDRADVRFLNVLGFNRAFFLPHAIDPLEFKVLSLEKEIDILFMGTCYDYRLIEQNWEKKFDALSIQVLQRAKSYFFEKPLLRFTDATDLALADFSFDCSLSHRLTLMKALDFYVRSYDRIHLLKEIALHFQVTLIGGGPTFAHIGGHWPNHFTSAHQVQFFPALSYAEVFSWMQRAKIVLNSSPCYYEGSHERILMGLLGGSAIITNRSKYVEDSFGKEAGVFYYTPGYWEEALSPIELLLRESSLAIAKGKDLVLKEHTWKQRVETLLDLFPDLYASIFSSE